MGCGYRAGSSPVTSTAGSHWAGCPALELQFRVTWKATYQSAKPKWLETSVKRQVLAQFRPNYDCVNIDGRAPSGSQSRRIVVNMYGLRFKGPDERMHKLELNDHGGCAVLC